MFNWSNCDKKSQSLLGTLIRRLQALAQKLYQHFALCSTVMLEKITLSYKMSTWQYKSEVKSKAMRHFKIGTVLKTTATFYSSLDQCGIRTELLNLGAPIGGLG